MTRHVVFGTGQAGRHVVEQLISHGIDVIAVNRSGRGQIAGAQIVAGDATDPTFTTEVAAGADAVYFCLNATNYAQWAQEFPPLQRGVLAGAEAAGARLVVLDNLYAYGPTGGRPLVETMQERPSSIKAATRAAMTAELLRAHAAGRVEVAIGRASDYFGPGAAHSALGETVFGTALTGRTAQVMGDPDQPHSGMAGAALLAIAGFTALGSIFDYPKILKEPTDHLLEAFRTNQSAVTTWFLVLAISAALLAPVGVLLGRIAGGTLGRWIAGVGIAAAAVQVIGLSRWVLLVPGTHDATVAASSGDAHRTFETLHFWLGTVVGENLGYVLTATFTVLVVVSLSRPTPRAIAPRWIGYLGYAAAALIATGVLVPFGVGPATMTNFVGYVAWCGWLIVTTGS